MAGPLAIAILDEVLRLFAMLFACARLVIAVVAAIGLLAIGAPFSTDADVATLWARVG